MTRSAELRALFPGLYPVAALLFIAPFADMLGAAWPVRPAEVAWRFGSIGLGLGVVIIQTLGLALALAVAAAAGPGRSGAAGFGAARARSARLAQSGARADP